jgi:ATP-dependent helicase/nuclease subunit B
MIRVLAGLEFGGASLTELDDLEPGRGGIGQAVWSPAQLLRDLELRLGLGAALESEALRIARWGARIAELAPLGRFYSKSFEVDALETARSVLRLRDSLVEAGWNGQAISAGGARLQAIVELENLGKPSLPFGYVDRLAGVERALSDWRTQFYSELVLAESAELWSTRWRTIFRALERTGTRLTLRDLNFHGARADSDLGKVQAALRAGNSMAPVELRGDGSFVLLTAETSWEAGCSTAAILDNLPATQTVVIRESDVSAFDNALSIHGARSQGWRSVSPWRAALQIMPLALELAFEPKDPQRVLELLTLPVGPFLGFAGRRLAEALTQSPGIGGPAWEEAKSRLVKGADKYAQSDAIREDPTDESERSKQLLARIEGWLEQPGDDAVSGAPRVALLAVIERVRSWIISRIPASPEDTMLLTAARHAGALRAALESDPRPILNLVEVRRLAESVLESGAALPLIKESAGRVAHVDRAGNLRVARSNVVWWSFVAGGAVSLGARWRQHEVAALMQVGIVFPDAKKRLAERAVSWRQGLLAATERAILVAPRKCAGETTPIHPLWDELVACTRADEAALERITLDASALRSLADGETLLPRPSLRALAPVALPGGHGEWRVPAETVTPIDHFSPASLNSLLGCPLQWGLQYRAGISAGGHALPPLFMLNGTLGHRLVELLYPLGAFDKPLAELRERAEAELDQLFQREGAILLRAGMVFERSQLRRQLVTSMLELSNALNGAGLRIVAVEKPIEVTWRDCKLVGRLDLLVATADNVLAIVDVKWGWSSYRDLLKSGHALQLAVYAAAHAAERGDRTMPEAAYFSLKQQKLFGLPAEVLPNAEEVTGPSLQLTWERIELSVDKAEQLVESGRFPVTGVRQSLPLLTSLGVPESSHGNHFGLPAQESCKHCGFDAICGRRWEAVP